MLVTRRAARLSGETSIDLAPALLGSGVPDLEQLEGAPILLDGPTPGHPWRPLTHVRYRVRRP